MTSSIKQPYMFMFACTMTVRRTVCVRKKTLSTRGSGVVLTVNILSLTYFEILLSSRHCRVWANTIDFRCEFVPDRTRRNGTEPDADAAGGEGLMSLFLGQKEALRH